MKEKEPEDRYFIAKSYVTQFFDFPQTQLFEVEWLKNMLVSYRQLNVNEQDKLLGFVENVIRNLRIRSDD